MCDGLVCRGEVEMPEVNRRPTERDDRFTIWTGELSGG